MRNYPTRYLCHATEIADVKRMRHPGSRPFILPMNNGDCLYAIAILPGIGRDRVVHALTDQED